jgi:starch-binding outer membrane protein SusE/F
MKLFSKLLSVLAVVAVFASCDKKDSLTSYAPGNTPKLQSTTLSVAPLPVDSNNNVITFNWTDPRYSINGTTKYVLEIDSVTKGFSNPYRREMTGQNTTSIIAKDLNNWMLSRGYAFNTPVKLEARLVSSYSNNNERLISNIIPLTVTPYKIPPRVTLPVTGHLYITGNAAPLGWINNASLAPAQELTQIDATTWGAIINMQAGGQYLILPNNNGDWSKKYAIAGQGSPNTPTSGTFGYHVDGQPAPDIYVDNFVGPTAGWYKLVLDFQQGTYKLTPLTNGVPNALYLTGDAVPSGWTNTPPATQQLTRLTNSVFQITNVALQPGKAYKLLSTQGQWQPQFGGSSATGGTLGANWGGGTDPDAIPTPTAPGNYTITVNFLTNTYTVQ